MSTYSKSVTTIRKHKDSENVGFGILSAGVGSRIKTYEPRSLLKIKDKTLISHQIEAIQSRFKDPEIIGVFGTGISRVVKSVRGKIRVVENQNYENTNNSESLRLAINNSIKESFMFIHGDMLIDQTFFGSLNFNKSFIVYEDRGMMDEKEIGVTVMKNKATILSYGLEEKWCQAAFFKGKEIKILRNIFNSFTKHDKKTLTFELINKIIDSGGSFQAHKLEKSKILEIDCIKDIK
jgi:choline kinase